MTALAIILIPGGIIAALICFRWARTAVVWVAASIVIWFAVCVTHVHAQSSPMVQCRIESWSQVMPDYACEAMEAGAAKLDRYRSDPDGSGVKQCAAEMTHYLEGRSYQFINPCISVWVALRQDHSRQKPWDYVHPENPPN